MSQQFKFKEVMGFLKPEERKVARRRLKEIREQCKLDLEKDIDRDKKHHSLMNLCIFPFQSISGEGYKKTTYMFVIADPLCDFKKGILDILLFNLNEKAIVLIECKSSISKPEEEIKEFSDKIDEHLKRKEEYEALVGSSIDEMEFVLCVPAIDFEKVKDIISKQKNKNQIILWTSDIFEGKIKISSYFTKHKITEMQKFLEEGIKFPDYNNVISFSANSHIAIILEEISNILNVELVKNNKNKFTFNDLVHIIKKEMLNQPDNLIKTISETVLGTGIKVGVFSFLGKQDGIDFYRLSVLYNKIKDKYIESIATIKAKDILKKQLETKIKDRLPKETQAKL